MAMLTTRAGAVHCTESGTGRPVVLLHATLHDHHDFDAVAPAIAARHRVVAIDWPGHGASPTPTIPVTGPLLAGVLADVVDELALEAPVIIGSSVGGYAASRFAIERPDAVAGVVLVNAAGFTPTSPFTRAFCRTLGRPAVARRVLPHLVPRYMRARTDLDAAIVARASARARSEEGARVAASLWRSFAEPDYDLRDRAAEHRVPTRIVWGDRDIVLGARAGRHAQRQLPDAGYATFATGHVVFSSDPEGFLDVVLPFIDSLTPAALSSPDA